MNDTVLEDEPGAVADAERSTVAADLRVFDERLVPVGRRGNTFSVIGPRAHTKGHKDACRFRPLEEEPRPLTVGTNDAPKCHAHRVLAEAKVLVLVSPRRYKDHAPVGSQGGNCLLQCPNSAFAKCNGHCAGTVHFAKATLERECTRFARTDEG